ncbi:MAG: PilZ domain-containing protein [Methylovulum sp.]|jgi:hypothetical protein|nr:PilZ domain-containing protein [Methylovulum sp.]MCF8007663.1 PilZ domain-containing protein [Methylovulum sp.]
MSSGGDSEYSEQRRFVRMALESDLHYRFSDSFHFFKGTCKNLSSSGILFTAHQSIDAGVLIEIEIAATDNSHFPSMKALFEVIRTRKTDEGLYEISAEITGVRTL